MRGGITTATTSGDASVASSVSAASVASGPAERCSGTSAALIGAVFVARQRWLRGLAVDALLVASACALALIALLLVVVALTDWADGRGTELIVLAAFAAVTWAGLRGWRDGRTATDVGRWAAGRLVDRRAGERLRTALELALRWRVAGGAGDAPERGAALRMVGSPALLERTVGHGRASLHLLDSAADADGRTRGKLALATATLLLAHFASTWLAPEPWQRLWQEPIRRGDQLVIVVGTLVGDVRLDVRPPAYARDRLGTTTSEGTQWAVLRGSEVLVTARPLDARWALRIESRSGDGASGEPIVPEPVAGGALGWRTTIDADLQWRYVGLSQDGRPMAERAWRAIESRPDRPPQVQIRAPVGEVEVRAGQQIVVEATADDDIGLSAVDLVIARPSGALQRRELAIALGDVRAEVRESLQVDALSLGPGEVATLQIEARDNDTFDGGHRSLSQKVVLRMFSPERHHARVLDALDELAVYWTQRLGDRLEGDPQRGEIDVAGALDARARMADSEAVGLGRLEELGRQLADDLLGRTHTAADLKEVHRLLEDRLGEESRALLRVERAATESRGRRDLFRILQQHQSVIETEEKALGLMLGIARVEHRGALARAGKALQQTGERLEEALAALAAGSPDAGAAEVERLLGAVERQLEDMMATVARQTGLVPAERVNPGALDEGGLRGELIERHRAIEEIRDLLRQGRVEEAQELAKRLGEALGKLTRSLEEQVAHQRTVEEEALARLVGELRRGIGATQRAQEQVRGPLRAARDEQYRAGAEHLRRMRQSAVPAVRDLFDDARDQIRPRRLQTAELRASRAVANAREALSTALGELEAGQVDAAMQAAAEAEDRLSAARRSLAEMTPSGPAHGVIARQRGADLGRLVEAADRVRRASARLRDALPAPGSLLSPGTRRVVAEQRRPQEAVRRRLEKVRHRLARHASAHPALERQVGGRLDHALEMMRQSGQSLDGYDARGAFEQAGETLDALERASSILDEMDERADPDQAVGQADANARDGGRVELERGNATDGAETLRAEILRARKQGIPAEYRARLERYYKAIVR